MKVNPIQNRIPAAVQETLTKEIGKLETRKAELEITGGVLDMEAKVTATPADQRPSAVDAKWGEFTQALGSLWNDAKAQGAALGGREGIGRELESIEDLKFQLHRLVSGDSAKHYGAMPADLANAIDIVAAIGWAGKKDVSPELKAALDRLDDIHQPVLEQYKEAFDGTVRGERPLKALVAQPEGFPPIGEQTLPEYMHTVAKELRAGRFEHLIVKRDHWQPNEAPQPSSPGTRQRVADELDALADARAENPDSMNGSIGHFAISNDGPLIDWLESFSSTQIAYYNLSVRMSDD